MILTSSNGSREPLYFPMCCLSNSVIPVVGHKPCDEMISIPVQILVGSRKYFTYKLHSVSGDIHLARFLPNHRSEFGNNGSSPTSVTFGSEAHELSQGDHVAQPARYA